MAGRYMCKICGRVYCEIKLKSICEIYCTTVPDKLTEIIAGLESEVVIPIDRPLSYGYIDMLEHTNEKLD